MKFYPAQTFIYTSGFPEEKLFEIINKPVPTRNLAVFPHSIQYRISSGKTFIYESYFANAKGSIELINDQVLLEITYSLKSHTRLCYFLVAIILLLSLFPLLFSDKAYLNGEHINTIQERLTAFTFWLIFPIVFYFFSKLPIHELKRILELELRLKAHRD